MLVITCESCNTKFRIDSNRLKGRKSKVRCTRCGNVFQVPDSEDDDKVIINLDSSEDSLLDEDVPEFSPPPKPIVQPGPKKPNWVRLIALGFCALIVCTVLFMLAKKVLTSNPGSSTDKEIASKVEEPAIAIPATTKAYFLENSHIGQIFVVEGEIVNEGTKPVSFVLLEGKLYTTNNQTAQTQKSFCGNTMSREELSSLGIVEIQNRMMNREGKNMSNVHVIPKARVPFMVVFHNLPEFDQLSDYSVEVKSSQVD